MTPMQLASMLDMQDSMNTKVNPNWIAANNNWHRAICVEAVEAIEHHGWKWWKKQECDIAQLRMELVDIWHFMLSAAIQQHGGAAQAQMEMLAELNLGSQPLRFDNRDYILAPVNLLEKLDLLVGLAAAQRTSLALFESILADCDMDWMDLYKQYVGKNVLNFFRQDHGYKAGSYIKMWHGREDNEHLLEVLERVDTGAEDVRAVLYQSLKTRYESVLADGVMRSST